MRFKANGNDENNIGRIISLYPLYDNIRPYISNLGDGKLYGCIDGIIVNKKSKKAGIIGNQAVSMYTGFTLNLNDSDAEADESIISELFCSTPDILSEEDTKHFKEQFPGFFL